MPRKSRSPSATTWPDLERHLDRGGHRLQRHAGAGHQRFQQHIAGAQLQPGAAGGRMQPGRARARGRFRPCRRDRRCRAIRWPCSVMKAAFGSARYRSLISACAARGNVESMVFSPGCFVRRYPWRDYMPSPAVIQPSTERRCDRANGPARTLSAVSPPRTAAGTIARPRQSRRQFPRTAVQTRTHHQRHVTGTCTSSLVVGRRAAKVGLNLQLSTPGDLRSAAV